MNSRFNCLINLYAAKYILLSCFQVIEVINKSLRELDVDYIDMVLIHSPAPSKRAVAKLLPELMGKLEAMEDFAKARLELWESLQICRKSGTIKHIGVSNFSRKHIEELISSKR